VLRRVLSVLQRRSALCRYAFAGTAALGLALACLNPQNDDLPSYGDRAGGEAASNPANQGADDSADQPLPNTPQPPALAPSPAPAESEEPLAPANEPGSEPPAAGDDLDAPDAGASDAGGASDPSVAP
jgi:hypothetical protein